MPPKRPREDSEGIKVAFVGLGAMGFPLAGHLAQHFRTMVFNRTPGPAAKHAEQYGSIQASTLADVAGCGASVIFLCLPTSAESKRVCTDLNNAGIAPGTVVVDCTSGQPKASVEIAQTLSESHVLYCDCLVSGGPRGAAAGTVTAMLGSPDKATADQVQELVTLFSKRVVRVGGVGSAHAVKAINNTLNVTHLLLASEGLLALKQMGVPPEIALSCINGSSGRSLQTEARLPEECVSGRFNYGFKLGLMLKDVRIGMELLDDHFPQATILRQAADVLEKATSECGNDVDYTCAVQHLEKQCGATLASGVNESRSAAEEL